MELAKAVTRAMKFVPKKSDNPMHSCLRLMPKGESYSARVMSTDGTHTCVIDVDGDLPNAVIPGVALGKVAKAKVLEVVEKSTGLYCAVTSAGDVSLEGGTVSGFPGIPGSPTLEWVEDWDVIARTAHAAATDKNSEEVLKCVHFTKDYVEASDRHRLVRVCRIPSALEGLVPVSIFKSWPKGPVTAGSTRQHAFFRVGAELRIVNLLAMKYPDVGKHMIPNAEGSWWVAPVSVLVELVKQAILFSQTKTLSLCFGLTGVEIGAWNAKDDVEFGGHVQAQPGTSGAELSGGSLFVHGKFLLQALKCLTTPNVRLCYQGSLKPLRLESGPQVEYLWPSLAKKDE